MTRRKLKNYDKYLQLIELYAKATHVKIIYKPVDGEAEYTYRTRIINIDPDLDEATEIAALLHELGHSLDDTTTRDVSSEDLEVAYYNFYKEKNTLHQRELVLACEKRAWEYAEVIAKLAKIRLGKWFYDEKKIDLRWYRSQ